MKYTGRITVSILNVLIAVAVVGHCYTNTGKVEPYDVILALVMAVISWLLGKQYDKMKYYSKKYQENQEELQHIFDHVDASIWSKNIEKNQVIISSGVEKIFGYSKEMFLGDPNLWLQCVHPEDLQIVNDYYNSQKRIHSKCEYRINREDGAVRWVQDSCTPIFNDKGALTQLFGVVIDITERKMAEEKIQVLAYHDSLTGLLNRYALREYTNQLIEKASPTLSLAVLFLDLDRFKTINDTFGHHVGDQLLIEVAKRLKESVRSSDIVARQGGDEFIILFEDIQKEEVKLISNKIIDALERPIRFDQYELYITPSMGISFYPGDGMEVDTLIKQADLAMYEAKNQGKNQYLFYQSLPLQTMNRQMLLESGLHKALDQGELLLHYQPILDLETRKIEGVEVLLRWQHPEFGLVPPIEFIPIAEETGMIVAIGKWVLKQACQQFMSWEEIGISLNRLAVNISPRQFKDKHFISDVKRTLVETGMDPNRLEIEITESLMQNAEESMNIITELKQLGIRISIDDFGTGFSSLSLLDQLMIDYLKIDQSFIRGLSNQQTSTIVKTIIDLAKNLDFEIIAEGIELEEQSQFLQQHKGMYGQGFLFSRPLGANEMEKLLLKEREREIILHA